MRRRRHRAISATAESASGANKLISDPASYKYCFNSLLRMLGRRDHSEKELREKLSLYYSMDLVEKAINEASERKFLKSPDELAKALTDQYHRLDKGIYYIQRQLKKKGLPSTTMDSETELAKCQALFQKKFGDKALSSRQDQAKAFRYLAYRGFDSETVRKVIYEKR